MNAKRFNMLANGLFLLLLAVIVVAVVLVADLRERLLIGWPGFVALVLFALSALTAGHLIGGPQRDRKGGLAIACLARNLGLAIYIAEISDVTGEALLTILAYALIGSVLAMPYSVWNKRSNAS